MKNERENNKKQIPLRLSPSLYAELARWAEEDFRSLNGQIEYLLSECVRKRKKPKPEQPRTQQTEDIMQ